MDPFQDFFEGFLCRAFVRGRHIDAVQRIMPKTIYDGVRSERNLLRRHMEWTAETVKMRQESDKTENARALAVDGP